MHTARIVVTICRMAGENRMKTNGKKVAKAGAKSVRTLRKGSQKLRALVGGLIAKAARLEPKWPCRCRRCGYRWKARRKSPKFCSRCKSRAWMTPVGDSAPRRTRVRYWLGRKRKPTTAKGLATKGTPVYRAGKGWISAAEAGRRRKVVAANRGRARKAVALGGQHGRDSEE